MSEQAGAGKRRIYWLAGILSFVVPGAGQAFRGQSQKGFALALLALLLSQHRFTPIALQGIGWMLGLGFLLITLRVFAFVDALVGPRAQAGGDNNDSKAKRGRWAPCLTLVGTYILVTIGASFFPGTVKTYFIPAESMAPSILKGDYVVADLRAFRNEAPKVGDLATFLYPLEENVTYVSRVMATPGDTLQIVQKKLLLNGRAVPTTPSAEKNLTAPLESEDDRKVLEPRVESLAEGAHEHTVLVNPTSTLNESFDPVTLAEGKFFVLGDNRDRASDSRIWGPVSRELLLGRPVYVYFSLNETTRQIRWERFGKTLR